MLPDDPNPFKSLQNINRNPIPALTLAQDTSTLTACGNDYSFDDIFLRPFQALAKKNDILLLLINSIISDK